MESKDSGEFKVHIIGRGTKYIEKIKIDEENDVEYFHAPAHNGRTGTDVLFDFKTVSVKPHVAFCVFGVFVAIARCI